jgi:hypothetical protein
MPEVMASTFNRGEAMFNITRITRITISAGLVGILIGCTAIAHSLVTKSPVPFVPIALSASASITPAFITLLVASLCWKPLQRVIAPVLLLAGVAIPFDIAFACVLGIFDDVVLRGIIGVLFVSTAALLAGVMKTKSGLVKSIASHDAQSTRTQSPKQTSGVIL